MNNAHRGHSFVAVLATRSATLSVADLKFVHLKLSKLHLRNYIHTRYTIYEFEFSGLFDRSR